MSPPDLADLTITEAGRRLRDGTLTAAGLMEAHIARVRARDPVLRAFVARDDEHAMAAAAAADAALAQGEDRGPLHGIPVGLKDLIDTRDLPTRYGSNAVAADHRPAADALVARRLEAAGAVLAGKLATYEFALVGPSRDGPNPPATNPWSALHITGGSSSGCAAAVGGGLLRTSLGTDTGGSVRSPAGYCGVVGLKPTFGRVPTDGIHPLSPRLDHVGPLSATVAEAALTFDAVADPAPGIATAASGLGSPDLAGLRVGYLRAWAATDPLADGRVIAAADDAASHLSLLGARIIEASLPAYPLFEACGAVVLHWEALRHHEAALRQHGARYGRLAFNSLLAGLCLEEADLDRALRTAGSLRRAVDGALKDCDALLTVTTLAPAPPFTAFDGERPVWTPMRTIPFNVTGHPVLAMPAGFAGGLPVGIQLVGRAMAEEILCRIGDAYERTTGHGALRPPSFP